MQSEGFVDESSTYFSKKYSHGVFSIYKNLKHLVNKEGYSALFKGV